MEKWRTYRHSEIYRQAPRAKKLRLSLPPKIRLVILAIAVFALVIWVLFWSPLFKIKAIVPQGELTDVITANLASLAGTNLFRVSESSIYSQLRQVEPTTARVALTRGLPNELRVTVSRHHPALIWQVGETSWAVDEDGVVFQLDPTLADGIPRVIDKRNPAIAVGQPLLKPDLVWAVQSAFQETPNRVGGAIQHGEIDETTRSLRLVTEWGWSIYIDTNRPLAGQLENFSIVLRDYRAQVKEYVDLRLEGWAYVK